MVIQRVTVLVVTPCLVQADDRLQPAIRRERALAERLQHRTGVHSRILEILNRGPERRPSAGHRGEFIEPGKIRSLLAQPLMHPFPKKGFASEVVGNLTAPFFQHPQRQLVERQQMNVEKRLAILNTEGPLEVRA